MALTVKLKERSVEEEEEEEGGKSLRKDPERPLGVSGGLVVKKVDLSCLWLAIGETLIAAIPSFSLSLSLSLSLCVAFVFTELISKEICQSQS